MGSPSMIYILSVIKIGLGRGGDTQTHDGDRISLIQERAKNGSRSTHGAGCFVLVGVKKAAAVVGHDAFDCGRTQHG
jgi:hypothetical protein